KIVEASGELSLRGALIHVSVPPADISEGDLQTDIGFGELRNLLQCLTERAPRVIGAVLRLVSRRIRDLQHLDCVEGLAAGAVQNAISSGRVLGFERRPDQVACLARADTELPQLAHRERGRGSL